MNLLLFEPAELNSDNTVCLNDRRAEHIVRILGCKQGDAVRAGVINGPTGIGRIMAAGSQGSGSEVILHFTAENSGPVEPAVDLIMGLVRPIMLKKIFTQAASLGVGRIFLVNASRVEKSFFGASLLKEENYLPYLLHGLEQAKDTFLPQVSIHERFRPFVEDIVPTLAQNYHKMLVAHPEGSVGLQQAFGNEAGGRTLLAVGPEGGWIDFEVERFRDQSFVPVSLGHRVLRTDTAVVALLAQLMLLRGEG